MITKKTHIDNIIAGDIILHYGEIKTLSPCYISRGGFMGTTIWGDSYNLGTKPVIKIVKLNN